MAHMNQETKKRLTTKAKVVLPSGWKVSYNVKNYSTLNAVVKQMPRDDWEMLNAVYAKRNRCFDKAKLLKVTSVSYNLGADFRPMSATDEATDPQRLKEVLAWCNALDSENFDESNIHADYFHIGYYLWVKFDEKLNLV